MCPYMPICVYATSAGKYSGRIAFKEGAAPQMV